MGKKLGNSFVLQSYKFLLMKDACFIAAWSIQAFSCPLVGQFYSDLHRHINDVGNILKAKALICRFYIVIIFSW